MNKEKRIIKHPLFEGYFDFTRGERTGILALLLLCALVFSLPMFISHFYAPAETPDFSAFKNQFDSIEGSGGDIAISDSFGLNKKQTKTSHTLHPFTFNPNTVSASDLQKMGIAANHAQILINYRNSGGRFRTKTDLLHVFGFKNYYTELAAFIDLPEDAAAPSLQTTIVNNIAVPKKLFYFNPNAATAEELLALGLSQKAVTQILRFRERGSFRSKDDLAKIFDITPIDFARIEPYISIPIMLQPQIPARNTPPPTNNTTASITVIDINKASADDLIQIRGIGKFYAQNILKYRDKLGGFYKVDQIAETYNLPDSVFRKLQPNLQISSPIFRKIAVNKAPKEELQKHPYIGFNQANAIIAYRQQHGDFQSISDLRKIKILEEATLEKIHLYLEY